jgi:thiol-disulfide isomerase/thioredoxin
LLAGLILYGAAKVQEKHAVAAEFSPTNPTPREVQDDDRVRAPELDGGVAWLNTAGPLRLRDLRGKIVVLDFWTFCCINCIHTLPDLAKLEKKYPNQLVVIGIHSAKFDAEKTSENIRKAILRYEIAHPVVNDANLKIWQAYAVNSWPTLYLIDPEGYVVGRGSGEGLGQALDNLIAKQIDKHRAKKTLNEQPLRFDLAKYKERKDSPLSFPGKVLADAAGGRLFIADSTHHRIVVTDLDGKKIAVVGTGEAGFEDGPFGKAKFNDPQGMALHEQTLYVADRKNHRLRALDLKAGTVKTVAGNGDKDDTRHGGPAMGIGMNSPWDLLWHAGKLFIAMAGHHQIWVLDVARGDLEPYAGTGREYLTDGPLGESAFAQPSGLTSDGTTLYVADSEVSSVRALPLNGQGRVRTLVGEGLFEFGDDDGVGNKVRLQHALGVAWHDGKVYIADTYNSKLKFLDPARRSVETFPVVSKDGPAFDEPAGLSFAGDRLYVADTNASRIRVVDLKTKAVSTLALQGVEAPKPAAEPPVFPNPTRATLPAATVPGDGDLTLAVELKPPEGFKLNPEAQMTYLVEAVAAGKAAWSETKTLPEKTPAAFQITLPAAKLAGADALRLSLLYYECATGNQGLCQIKSQVWDVPLKFAAGAGRTIRLTGPTAAK